MCETRRAETNFSLQAVLSRRRLLETLVIQKDRWKQSSLTHLSSSLRDHIDSPQHAITRPQRHVLTSPSVPIVPVRQANREAILTELQACSGWRVPQRSPSAARRALYPRPTCTSNPKHAHTPLLPSRSQGQTASEPNGQGRCRSITQAVQSILSGKCMVPPAETCEQWYHTTDTTTGHRTFAIAVSAEPASVARSLVIREGSAGRVVRSRRTNTAEARASLAPKQTQKAKKGPRPPVPTKKPSRTKKQNVETPPPRTNLHLVRTHARRQV
jgi:hypothetical protein